MVFHLCNMTKLNSLARARVIGPEGGAEKGAAGTGIGEGDAGVDVLVVSSSGRKMHKESIQKGKNCNEFSGIFREESEAQIFLSGL